MRPCRLNELHKVHAAASAQDERRQLVAVHLPMMANTWRPDRLTTEDFSAVASTDRAAIRVHRIPTAGELLARNQPSTSGEDGGNSALVDGQSRRRNTCQ